MGLVVAMFTKLKIEPGQIIEFVKTRKTLSLKPGMGYVPNVKFFSHAGEIIEQKYRGGLDDKNDL